MNPGEFVGLVIRDETLNPKPSDVCNSEPGYTAQKCRLLKCNLRTSALFTSMSNPACVYATPPPYKTKQNVKIAAFNSEPQYLEALNPQNPPSPEVLCSGPTALKSLLLRFVLTLHAIDVAQSKDWGVEPAWRFLGLSRYL